jgi:apolipoprotein N-acyltransferase
LLALATALLCFANGRWILPLATWLAPVLLLRFLDLTPGRRPMLIALALYVGAFLFAWQRMVPAPLPLYILIVAGYALIYFVPYVLHRAMAGRLNGMSATLVFPSAWVAVEYVAQTFLSPYGSWFSLAYTQASNAPFVQLAAITGTYGLSFVVAWVASAAAVLLGTRRSEAGIRCRAQSQPSFSLRCSLAGRFGWRRIAPQVNRHGSRRSCRTRSSSVRSLVRSHASAAPGGLFLKRRRRSCRRSSR